MIMIDMMDDEILGLLRSVVERSMCTRSSEASSNGLRFRASVVSVEDAGLGSESSVVSLDDPGLESSGLESSSPR